jgi:uncharacterized protein (TIGR00290 family)
MKERIVLCWSGGKDSALALYRLLRDERYEVVSLLVTCNQDFQRVSMHGVRLELAEMQARAIGLPLDKVFVPAGGSNDAYQQRMSECLLAHKTRGVTSVAFGDIFLEDLKQWREDNLAQIGLRGVFPLWKNDPRKLMEQFIALGFKSLICCVSDAYLDERALGRTIDWGFLDALPDDVDLCGENGEFHSFVYDGPIFKEPLNVRVGECVYRPVEQTHPGASTVAVCPLPSIRIARGFWFCDLLAAEEPCALP